MCEGILSGWGYLCSFSKGEKMGRIAMHLKSMKSKKEKAEKKQPVNNFRIPFDGSSETVICDLFRSYDSFGNEFEKLVLSSDFAKTLMKRSYVFKDIEGVMEFSFLCKNTVITSSDGQQIEVGVGDEIVFQVTDQYYYDKFGY
jgi:hypothetical protein